MSRDRLYIAAWMVLGACMLWALSSCNVARAQVTLTVPLNATIPALCYPTLDATKAYPSRMPLMLYRTDGIVMYWYCWDGAKWNALFRSLHVDSLQTFLSKAQGASLDTVIARDTKAINDATDPRKKIDDLTVAYMDADPNSSCSNHIANNGVHKGFCEAIFTALNANVPAPLSQWIVAPAQYADGTRPTYAARNGALVSPSNGRIAAGSPCDCGVKVGVEPYLYCSVNGRSDQLALCRKAP